MCNCFDVTKERRDWVFFGGVGGAEKVQDVKCGLLASLEATRIAVWAERTSQSADKSMVTPAPKLPPSIRPLTAKELPPTGVVPAVRVCVMHRPGWHCSKRQGERWDQADGGWNSGFTR